MYAPTIVNNIKKSISSGVSYRVFEVLNCFGPGIIGTSFRLYNYYSDTLLFEGNLIQLEGTWLPLKSAYVLDVRYSKDQMLELLVRWSGEDKLYEVPLWLSGFDFG